ncbi:lipase, class 2 [Mycolicibacterium canariasense]|uniref:Lipase, class 2 n=2 Tax=Mycolicibacterium canariasense TaxID=228230 RepID=A0A100W9W3_MYCCR|nr:lipase, class 2 [Mycolicibacterium canariasense]
MWMAGGVAHADDTSTKGSSASSAHSGGDATPGKTDKPDKPAKPDKTEATDKSDTSATPGIDPKPGTTADDEPDEPAKADKPDKADTAKPARGSRKHTAVATAKTTTASKADTKPGPAPATSPDESADAPKTSVKTTSTAKTATVAGTTANLAVVPTALKVVSPSVAPSATAAVPTPVKQATQFVRQMVGLANDLALIAVSLVNNLAAAAATAIGPKPFLGVPYNIARVVAGTTATAAKLLDGTPLNATSEGPFTVDYGVGDLLAWLNPTKPPAGANDPTITVTPAHPLPIILLNGTTATQGVNWGVGAPVLANAGYKVYTFNYGNTTTDPNFPVQATADIRKSAQELADEVQRVLDETGADKVILIGHSQGGGIMPSYYINNLGGDAKVSQLIGIAPSNHGTDVNGLTYVQRIPVLGPLVFRIVDLFGAAWTQQAMGSSLQDEVYGDGDTRPGVLYTTISSKFDWVVTPYTQQALDGPNVTNIVLQDLYPGYNAGHLGIVFSAPTWDAVLGALAANPEANPLPATALAA